MQQRDEIEPMVPELPRDVRTDGGLDTSRRSRTLDEDEADAPLVPDIA